MSDRRYDQIPVDALARMYHAERVLADDLAETLTRISNPGKCRCDECEPGIRLVLARYREARQQ